CCCVALAILCHLVYILFCVFFFFFFFQAEDGIRDLIVTGVQTCALPILALPCSSWSRWDSGSRGRRTAAPRTPTRTTRRCSTQRSEERRVGKECRSRWSPDH